MHRVLSVYLPQWSIERLARRRTLRKGEPVLLVMARAGRELVVHASADAITSGVRAGMTLAHARALLAKAPVVAPVEPDKDAAGLLAIARMISRRFSPTVSSDPPDGLLIDITGCEHLFRGERKLVRALVQTLKSLGFTARASVAETVGAAWALARFAQAPYSSASRDNQRAALAELPIEALRLGADVVGSLREIGVERIGQLLVLPRASLPSRYGPEVLLRIDQALGTAFEPVTRIEDEAQYCVSMDLPGGTTRLESLELAVRSAIHDLCTQLERHEAGLRRMTAQFERLDDKDEEIVIQVSKATRATTHLWGLVRPKLERLNMGYGVEHLTLRASLVVRVAHEQGCFDSGQALSTNDVDAAFAEMLDTVASRISTERVRHVVLRENYRPERAAGFVNFMHANGTSKHSLETSSPLLRPRPSKLLHEPVPIDVTALSPDGPVLQIIGVRWRSDGNARRVIAACIGPERLGGEWWRGRESSRDYFCVQDELGKWLWVFRDHSSGSWFMHGEWA